MVSTTKLPGEARRYYSTVLGPSAAIVVAWVISMPIVIKLLASCLLVGMITATALKSPRRLVVLPGELQMVFFLGRPRTVPCAEVSRVDDRQLVADLPVPWSALLGPISLAGPVFPRVGAHRRRKDVEAALIANGIRIVNVVDR